MITYLLNSTNSQIQNLETGIIVLAVLFLIVFAAMICFIIILEKQIEKLTTKKKLTFPIASTACPKTSRI